MPYVSEPLELVWERQLVRSQSRSSCWVKQRGRLVCQAGGGWQWELWLPQDCLEIVCCLVAE